jgi:superoxide dismutase
MNNLLLHFFADEMMKLADVQRHQYYMNNRNKILQRQREYRIKNAARIARKQKIYRAQVKRGVIRQRQRISTGFSYTYGGYR